MHWTAVEPGVTNWPMTAIGMWGYTPVQITGVLVHFHFYRASICEGGLGSRNSVRLSVTRVDCDKTKWRTAVILMPHERAVTLLLWYQQWLVGDTPFPTPLPFTRAFLKSPSSSGLPAIAELLVMVISIPHISTQLPSVQLINKTLIDWLIK